LANTFNFVVKNGITVGTTPVIAANGTYISAIANTGVQPGIYGNTSSIPVITVGADGRVTAISNTAVATPPATAAIVTNVDTFTANGTGQTFVLSQTPYNINATFVNINGATQQKSSYTLSGNTITLSEIVPNGTIIEVSTNYNAANTGTNSGALVSTVDAFTANGNTTIFTLSSAPVNKNYTFVNIDGIDQQKSTYSITGNVITFSTAPPNGTNVEITAISSQTGAVFTYNTSGTNGQVLTLQSGAAVWANVNSTTSIANTGIVGLITASQIANVANTQITGLITSSQIANVANTQITGNITSSQITSISNTQITGVLALSQGGTGATSLANANIATTTSNTQSLNSVNTFGFKNRIINGAMVIAQRGTSAVNPTGGASTPVYTTIDRLGAWADATLNTSWTIQQSSNAPTGFSSSALVTSTAASTIGVNAYNTINQTIEAFNTSDLLWGTANAKTCTFSFWVNCSLTGTFAGYVYNNNYTYCYPFTYSIPTANIWTFITITITPPTAGTWLSNSNGIGLQVGLSMAVGSNYYGTANAWQAVNFKLSVSGAVNVLATNGATFYTTGWQFEVGTQATSFDFRDYGRELILCQRYCYVANPQGVYSPYGSGQAISTTLARIIFQPAVTMRATSTSITYSGTLGVVNAVDASITLTGLIVQDAGVCTMTLGATVASGLVAGNATRLLNVADTTGKIIISAEL